MEVQKWLLINPEGIVNLPKLKINPHPESLENKTVFLRWNGKHNGNVFLERIADLLIENVKGVKTIKSWEVLPETARFVTRRFGKIFVRQTPCISKNSSGGFAANRSKYP